MPICPPCATAADNEVKALKTDPRVPDGHPAEICRDHGRAGCTCQHHPVGTVTEREDQPHA